MITWRIEKKNGMVRLVKSKDGRNKQVYRIDADLSERQMAALQEVVPNARTIINDLIGIAETAAANAN